MRNWFLPGSMMALSLFSLLSLRSVAPGLATPQFIFFILGFGLFFIMSFIPYALLEKWRWLAYVGLIILLLIPLAIGTTTRGIAGWIDIGGIFSIQPSQLAIPVVGIVIAPYLISLKRDHLKKLLIILALSLFPAFLILIEPDLGTVVIFLLTLGTLLFLAPFPLKYFGGMLGLGLIAIVISWSFVLKPYQKSRITSFMQKEQDLQGASYNAHQSLIAVGSGALVGRGLGEGVQSHLRFLPERQTDFIFASLAEELGFIGSVVVILLYISIVLFCIYVSQKTTSKTGAYVCIAAAAVTLFQSTVNIGMNVGLLPITGVTLPLLSYGGSSVLATCLLFGIVQSLNREIPVKPHLHLT
jgi:rod shape determining protein RodA